MSAAIGNPHRPLSDLTIAEAVFLAPERFRLGSLITWIGRFERLADPLAGGDFDRALVRIRHRQDRRPPVHDVDNLVRGADGRWDLFTGMLNLVGATGVLAYSAQEPYAAEGPAREAADRLLHRLVAEWYDIRLDDKDAADLSADCPSWQRSPLGMSLSLRARFGVPIQIEPCLAAWYSSDDTQSRLFTRQCRGRVIVGPLVPAVLPSFLPDGAHARETARTLRELGGSRDVWRLCVLAPRSAFPEPRWDDPPARPRAAVIGGDLAAMEFDCQ